MHGRDIGRGTRGVGFDSAIVAEVIRVLDYGSVLRNRNRGEGVVVATLLRVALQ